MAFLRCPCNLSQRTTFPVQSANTAGIKAHWLFLLRHILMQFVRIENQNIARLAEIISVADSVLSVAFANQLDLGNIRMTVNGAGASRLINIRIRKIAHMRLIGCQHPYLWNIAHMNHTRFPFPFSPYPAKIALCFSHYSGTKTPAIPLFLPCFSTARICCYTLPIHKKRQNPFARHILFFFLFFLYRITFSLIRQ